MKEVVDNAGHNNTGGWFAKIRGGKGPDNWKRQKLFGGILSYKRKLPTTF